MNNRPLWDLTNIRIGDKVILWENRYGKVQLVKTLEVVKVNKTTFKGNGFDYLFYKNNGSIRGEESWFTHRWVTRYTDEQIATYTKREQEEKERNEVLAFVLQTQFRCLSTPTLKAIKEVIDNSCDLI